MKSVHKWSRTMQSGFAIWYLCLVWLYCKSGDFTPSSCFHAWLSLFTITQLERGGRKDGASSIELNSIWSWNDGKVCSWYFWCYQVIRCLVPVLLRTWGMTWLKTAWPTLVSLCGCGKVTPGLSNERCMDWTHTQTKEADMPCSGARHKTDLLTDSLKNTTAVSLSRNHDVVSQDNSLTLWAVSCRNYLLSTNDSEGCKHSFVSLSNTNIFLDWVVYDSFLHAFFSVGTQLAGGERQCFWVFAPSSSTVFEKRQTSLQPKLGNSHQNK